MSMSLDLIDRCVAFGGRVAGTATAVWRLIRERDARNRLQDLTNRLQLIQKMSADCLLQCQRNPKNATVLTKQALRDIYFAASEGTNADDTLDVITRIRVLSEKEILTIERDKDVNGIWIATPDLKPDRTNLAVARVVADNLNDKKMYTYFVPPQIQAAEKDELKRVLASTGASGGALDRISFREVPEYMLDHAGRPMNSALYFTDTECRVLASAYEEIHLFSPSPRGNSWNPIDEDHRNTFVNRFRTFV